MSSGSKTLASYQEWRARQRHMSNLLCEMISVLRALPWRRRWRMVALIAQLAWLRVRIAVLLLDLRVFGDGR